MIVFHYSFYTFKISSSISQIGAIKFTLFQVISRLDAEEGAELGKLEKLLENEFKEGAVKICEDAVNSALNRGGAQDSAKGGAKGGVKGGKATGGVPDGKDKEVIETFNKQVTDYFIS